MVFVFHVHKKTYFPSHNNYKKYSKVKQAVKRFFNRILIGNITEVKMLVAFHF